MKRKYSEGQTFNSFKLIEYKVGGRASFECECGTIKELKACNVFNGVTKSCGCDTDYFPRDNKIGRRYGKLTVQSYVTGAMYDCLCDCGNMSRVLSSNLATGHTKSCGCNRVLHGDYKTRIYRIWRGMKHRCQCVGNKDWENYGGRGITVCDEWQEFVPFRDWALANGYEANLTIDRAENDNGYTPQNCRWVTISEQNRNRRSRAR